MRFGKSIIDIIKERTSRRTYVPEIIDTDTEQKLRDLLKLENVSSPFGHDTGKCRFELVNVPEFDPEEQNQLGTHGLVVGAQQFIVGAIESSKYEREHFGYLMEYIILGATDFGLGTCWLGNSFNKQLFPEKIEKKPNENVPAITPIGKFPKKRRVKEKMFRMALKANKRNPWEELFFEEDFTKPLDSNSIGKYATLVEMVRLGPSAANKQPWRIVKESGKNIFHFYAVDITGNFSIYPPLDLGIAVCHWDFSAEELGVRGKWEFDEPPIQSEGYIYKISWVGE